MDSPLSSLWFKVEHYLLNLVKQEYEVQYSISPETSTAVIIFFIENTLITSCSFIPLSLVRIKSCPNMSH